MGARLVAEKVETATELRAAVAVGFDLFQGYAIGLPLRLERRDLSSTASNALRLLNVVNQEDFDFAEVEAIVRTDPAMTFKLLAFANSALAAQRSRVDSLRQALVLFGARNVRQVALLLFLASTADATPPFALVEALVAGLFGEALAQIAQRADIAGSCMLAGTLSHLDRLLGVGMTDLLRRLPVSADLEEALVHRGGDVGRIVQIARAFQAGEWTATDELAAKLGLTPAQLQPLYRESVVRAEQLMQGNDLVLSQPAG
jgi:EAL and modified HD-GYP domain-containing signal transduction protein